MLSMLTFASATDCPLGACSARREGPQIAVCRLTAMVVAYVTAA